MKYVVLCVGHLYKPFGTTKIWPSWQGGSGKVKICPRMAWIWLWSRPEAPNWSDNPEMDPIWPPQLALIDLSPFPDLSKHCSLYISKNINYLILLKISISEILTFTASNDRTRPFSYDLVIFLSVPHVGWLRKINKPWKKCIVWSVEAVKVTCIFFRILG